MKVQNKKTGEIVEATDFNIISEYNSLAELNADWKDYEENEYYYAITSIKADDGITKMKSKHNDMTAFDKSIGNYFTTREEAQKAVEKLKAWKRLQDKGFRFEGIKQDYTRFFSQQKPMRIGRKYLQFNKAEDEEWLKENWEDLDLLFNEQEYIRKKAQKIVEDNADYYDKFGGEE